MLMNVSSQFNAFQATDNLSGWKKEFQERVDKAVEDTEAFRTKDRITEAPTYVEQLQELGERLAAYAIERDTINREEVRYSDDYLMSISVYNRT